MADDDYNSMVSRAPQGGNPNYWNLTQPQQLGATPQQAIPGPQLPQMSQGGGAQQFGAQGMPSNGGQPNFLQRFARNAMAMQGATPGQQGPQQGGNPFLAAVARWHQAQQQRPGGLPGAPQGPQGGPQGVPQPQWGPNPIPQGMRGPATMPPPGQVPWAGQNVQWGPPVSGQQGGGGNGS